MDNANLFGDGEKKNRTVDFFILDRDDLNKFIWGFAIFSPRLVFDISELIYPTKD